MTVPLAVEGKSVQSFYYAFINIMYRLPFPKKNQTLTLKFLANFLGQKRKAKCRIASQNIKWRPLVNLCMNERTPHQITIHRPFHRNVSHRWLSLLNWLLLLPLTFLEVRLSSSYPHHGTCMKHVQSVAVQCRQKECSIDNCLQHELRPSLQIQIRY